MTARLDSLTRDYAARFPDAFARILSRGDADEASRILLALPPELKASIVARLPAGTILRLLESGEHSPVEWLTDASFDDAVDLLSRMSRERRLTLIGSLTDERRKRQLLRHEQYPAHTVGWYVQDVQMRINADSPVTELVNELRELDSGESPLLVVVDAQGQYCGVLDPWQVFRRVDSAGPVRDYLTAVEPLYPETPVESAAQDEGLLSNNWLPVIDSRQRVLGGVRRAALLRAAGQLTPPNNTGTNLLAGLVGELVYALGALLDGLLAPGKTR